MSVAKVEGVSLELSNLFTLFPKAVPNIALVAGSFTQLGKSMLSMTGITTAFKGVFASLGTLISAHPIIAATVAIAGAVAIYQKQIHAAENAKKALDNSKQE